MQSTYKELRVIEPGQKLLIFKALQRLQSFPGKPLCVSLTQKASLWG